MKFREIWIQNNMWNLNTSKIEIVISNLEKYAKNFCDESEAYPLSRLNIGKILRAIKEIWSKHVSFQ